MGLYAHDDKRASQSDSDTSKCDEKLHKNGKSGEIKWIPLNNLLKKVDEDSSLEYNEDESEKSECHERLVTGSKLFLKAFERDDFIQFQKLLQSTYYGGDRGVFFSRIKRKTRTDFFDVHRVSNMSGFEMILNSDEQKASKYISAALKAYKLWGKEQFYEAVIPGKNVLMFYIARTTIVENFFSFLMFDWFDAEAKRDMHYCLVLKADQFEKITEVKLFDKILSIVDDPSEGIYKDVCLRIIFQYLIELEKERKASETLIGSFIEKVYDVKNPEYREQLLQVLFVFWCSWRSPRNDEAFESLTSKILSHIKTQEIVNFFLLAILLKKKQSVKFLMEFEEYIDDTCKTFGDYSQTILKAPVRLLWKITQRQVMLTTGDFIVRKCPYVNVKSSIMETFIEVKDFRLFNIAPFEVKELQDLESSISRDDLKSADLARVEYFLRDLKVIDNLMLKDLKKFFFGINVENKINYQGSIFERILATPKSSNLIKLIRKKCQFLATSEGILVLKNSQGKTFLDYAIESKDDENILSFLKLKFYDDSKFTDDKYYWKIKNDQYTISNGGKSLMQHYFSVLKKENYEHGGKFFRVIAHLLEEVALIDFDVPTEEVAELVKNKKSDNRRVQEKTLDIEMLFGNIVAYWTRDDKKYDSNKEKLLPLGPFFEMIFDIIEGNDEKFLAQFQSNLEMIEESCRACCAEDKTIERYITSFLFFMFLSAIRNDRETIIDKILNYETFFMVEFPSNMQTNKTTHYVAAKLLEKGYEMDKKQIPSDWITPEVFRNFLDSKIKFDDRKLVEIDCSLFLHPETKKCQVRSKHDVDNKLIFWEDTKSLEHIVNDEILRNFITHPVISTYINLKTVKQRGIFELNFWLFFVLFILPFGCLISCRFLSSSTSGLCHFTFTFAKFFCPLSIIFLISREYIQYRFVDRSVKKYFLKTTNWTEILLIKSSTLLLIALYLNINHDFLAFLSVVTILLTTEITLAMLPYASIPFYMMMLKDVATTFFRAFLTFVIILLAFTISFCIIFGEDEPHDSHENLVTANNDFFINFHSVPTAFLKTVLMLSGEYSIEPLKFSIFELIFFLIFVLITFIIFNLIIGLTLDDVQRIRKKAEHVMLMKKARRFIETSEKCLEIYKKFRLDDGATKNLNFLTQLFVMTLRSRISKFPYLHKIDKLYVNIATKEFYVQANRKLEKATDKKMDDKIFENIGKTLKSRDSGIFFGRK